MTEETPFKKIQFYGAGDVFGWNEKNYPLFTHFIVNFSDDFKDRIGLALSNPRDIYMCDREKWVGRNE